jgi:hypothetical protein
VVSRLLGPPDAGNDNEALRFSVEEPLPLGLELESLSLAFIGVLIIRRSKGWEGKKGKRKKAAKCVCKVLNSFSSTEESGLMVFTNDTISNYFKSAQMSSTS